VSKLSKNLLIIFGLSLLIRIIYIYLLIPDDFNFRLEDQNIYTNIGLSIIQTGEFVHQTDSGFEIETERTPLYPAFLSVIWLLTDYNPWFVIFVQAVIDSFSCIVIGLIVAQVIPKALIAGGILSAFNMNMVASSGMILTDSLFLLPFSLFLLTTLIYLKNRNLSYMIFLSITLALSVLIRPVTYYMLPILPIVFLWYLVSKKESLAKVFLHIVMFLLIASILLSPLIIRNYQKFNTISITSQTGLHLSKYLTPLAIHFSKGKTYQEAVTEVNSKIEQSKQFEPIDNSNPFNVSSYESNIAINKLFDLGFTNIAYAWMVGSTLNLSSSGVMVMPWVRALPHKSFYHTEGSNFVNKVVTFVTDVESIKYIVVILIANLISMLMFVLKLFGVYAMLKNKDQYGGRWIVFFILGTISYFLLITGPVIGVKYMLPIEPLLTVLFIVGIKSAFNIRYKF
jgi:hypothetical protein